AQEESYSLRIAGGQLSLVACDPRGLQHGLCTLLQLLALAPGQPGQLELPELELEDFPDLRARGVMLDVSRDKVPTLATLRSLIDRLASWKINQLQLYFEHSFAYVGHDVVWQNASAYTAEEMRELDAYAAERHIELVPNQNSFGHMHRWLVHEPYRRLAECPEGFDHPWNWTREPYGLCATDPGSLALLEGLYDQLLPQFRSRQFNVGLDETIDLGHGRSQSACEERGTERVYLEFLKEVHARVQARGHRMMFWGDIIVKRPELIAELPRDAIALEWGYEADHPFAEHLLRFREAGLEFYVCPGTSSWNSIAGRSQNALLNLARAAEQGNAAGAAGLLITDWGDHGHLQPLPVSYLGFLLGAGFSWNVADAQRAEALDVPSLLDRHAFFDAAGVLGRVAHDLGNAYREAGSLRPNASVLFWILIKPERLFAPPGVSRELLERTLTYVERVSQPLAQARSSAPDAALVLQELGWARDMLAFACRLGIARSAAGNTDAPAALPGPRRAALAVELGSLIEQHRALWLQRNRPGGLDDSARRLENLLQSLRG
ncbi:MAG TPA: beta-N-acetylhexosaminidase, partial [Polyangiaceae bacterium]|nr:beta-N-acetylhexosaminidase [Polyangiaceae bacterium]